MKNKINLIIAGGRDFDDSYKMYEAYRNTCINYNDGSFDVTIFSGNCKTGADRLGELLAEAMDLNLKLFPADWNKYGKSAGPIRNEQMAKEADRALIFWDGKSKGTLNLINCCNKHKVPLTIIEY